MSYPQYPAAAGLQWDIVKRPIWNTLTERTAAGNEFRTATQQYPIYEFDLKYDYLAPADVNNVLGLYLNSQGSFGPFYFDNPNDDTISASSPQGIGIGDGSTTAFTLLKSTGSFLEPIGGVGPAPIVYTSAYYGGGTGIENLLTYSQDYTQAAWLKQTGVTITANSTTAPDGTVTADTMAYSGAGASGGTRIAENTGVTAPNGVQCTYSVWLKVASGTQNLRIGFIGYAVTPITVTSTWTRFSFTITSNGSNVLEPEIASASGDNSAFSVFAWGNQVERYSTANGYLFTGATSYTWSIPTNGTQVTFSVAPLAAAVLTWSGTYLYLCKFKDDQLDINQFANLMYEQKGLTLRTVR